MYFFRRHGIHTLTQWAVTGDCIYPEHGFQIVALHLVLHATLKGENGRILKKHHGQSAHKTVVQGIVDFTCLPTVIDIVEELWKSLSQRTEAQMFFGMHPIPQYIGQSINIYNNIKGLCLDFLFEIKTISYLIFTKGTSRNFFNINAANALK